MSVRRSIRRTMIATLLVVGVTLSLLHAQGSQIRQEESEDYYKKWLEQDVVYIISDEEKEIFKSLSTPEEKERFIEGFWRRRDPNLRTSVNEFKEEHYRRIAYANEKFQSGAPGWKTDRGRIYITHGPPDSIESYPSGGSYKRPIAEGGGYTSVFPFEIWHYRQIRGIGDGVALEFVDRTQSGEYRLALRPEEKDALLHVTGAGLTLAESLGYASKSDRPYFNPGLDYPYHVGKRVMDDPFIRYETYAKLKGAPEIRRDGLQEQVRVNLGYRDVPITVLPHYFQLSQNRVLASVTFQIENKNLMFAREEDGLSVARVKIYGLIKDMTGRIVEEFEDELNMGFATEDLAAAFQGESLYQQDVVLESRYRYKLEAVVKDLKSNRVGAYTGALSPPDPSEGTLSASSVLLSKSVRRLKEPPAGPEMFVLGDLKMYPSIDRVFSSQEDVHLYFQIYNAQLDQATLSPELRVTYRVLSGDQVVLQKVETKGESLEIYSGGRIEVLQRVPVEALDPGKYSVEVVVWDQIAKEEVTVIEDLVIEG